VTPGEQGQGIGRKLGDGNAGEYGDRDEMQGGAGVGLFCW